MIGEAHQTEYYHRNEHHLSFLACQLVCHMYEFFTNIVLNCIELSLLKYWLDWMKWLLINIHLDMWQSLLDVILARLVVRYSNTLHNTLPATSYPTLPIVKYVCADICFLLFNICFQSWNLNFWPVVQYSNMPHNTSVQSTSAYIYPIYFGQNYLCYFDSTSQFV